MVQLSQDARKNAGLTFGKMGGWENGAVMMG
jgi:hypothetical protein